MFHQRKECVVFYMISIAKIHDPPTLVATCKPDLVFLVGTGGVLATI